MNQVEAKTQAIAIFCIVAITMAGCSTESRGKVTVSGVVEWNGTPLTNGYISFATVDGKKPPESGKIENGRYSFEAYPGSSKVRILSTKEVGFDHNMNQPNLVQFIPVEYNANTELTCDVQRDGDNEFDFELAGEEAN